MKNKTYYSVTVDKYGKKPPTARLETVTEPEKPENIRCNFYNGFSFLLFFEHKKQALKCISEVRNTAPNKRKSLYAALDRLCQWVCEE